MKETLKIHMLGEFSIQYGDKKITDQINRSKKLWSVLEYLITFRDREIPQSELIDLLWPDDDTVDAANALKTLLHRVRSVIGELGIEGSRQVISYRGGTYAWTPGVPCEIDVEVFESLCGRAYGKDTGEDEKLACLLKAAEVYKGDFLPKNSLDSWVVPLCTYYRSQYNKVVLDAAEILNSREQYDETLILCQKATVIDPYEESLHLCLLKAMIALGKYQQALTHYDYVYGLMFSKFGINPSDELTELYRDVIKTTKSTELNLNTIREDLQETERKAGSYYCEYEIFRNVYRIEARSASRTGQAVFVCLITMTDKAGKSPEREVLEKNMDRMKAVILNTLRRGDVFTRYSVSQYLIMLPTISFENGDMVMKRIVKRFKKDNLKAPVVLNYSLLPLAPSV